LFAVLSNPLINFVRLFVIFHLLIYHFLNPSHMKTARIVLLTLTLTTTLLLPTYAQLKVVASGDVGIGTATPTQKLDVVGNMQARGSYFLLGSEAGASEAGVMVGWGRTTAGQATIRFYNTFSGYSSFATTFGVDPFGAGGLFHNGAGPLGVVTQNTSPLQIGTNGVEKMRINGTDGFVGINTATPGFQLEVNGDAAKPGGGVWSTASDRRLKKDVKPFSDGLDKILAINPVTFKYNGEGGIKADGKDYVGVIAQEIQQVAPYTVSTFTHKKLKFESKEGSFLPMETVVGEESFLSYDGTALTYMLINAIKEQQKMIEEKDVQLKTLESRLDKLEALVRQTNTSTTTTSHSSQSITLASNNDYLLKQNEPNPFNQTTRFRRGRKPFDCRS
jgi:hypothetical protein